MKRELNDKEKDLVRKSLERNMMNLVYHMNDRERKIAKQILKGGNDE